MAKPPRPWIVTPHDPLVKHDDNVWSVDGQVPGLNFRRRMAIVKRGDGSLLFYNAIPLDEKTLADVRALGKPGALVIPHHLHMIDAHPFMAKLGIPAYGPRVVIEEIAKRHVTAKPIEELPADASVRAESVTGFKTGEAVLLSTAGGRTTLIVADVVLNARKRPGFSGLMMNLMGFTGPTPRLPGPVKMRVLKDRKSVRAQLETWAGLPGMTRIIVSHGEIVDSGAADALRTIAQTV